MHWHDVDIGFKVKVQQDEEAALYVELVAPLQVADDQGMLVSLAKGHRRQLQSDAWKDSAKVWVGDGGRSFRVLSPANVAAGLQAGQTGRVLRFCSLDVDGPMVSAAETSGSGETQPQKPRLSVPPAQPSV